MSGDDMDNAQLAKVNAEIVKLIAESGRINAEARWYPLVMVVGIIAALGAVMKFL